MVPVLIKWLCKVSLKMWNICKDLSDTMEQSFADLGAEFLKLKERQWIDRHKKEEKEREAGEECRKVGTQSLINQHKEIYSSSLGS